MRKDINETVQSINEHELESINELPVKWSEAHWGGRDNVGAEYYVDGFYQNLSSLNASGSSLLRVPVMREGEMNLTFKNHDDIPEFWFHKDTKNETDFSFFVESVPDAGGGYGTNGGGYNGGGSIQSFWTDKTGLVINAINSKFDYPPVDWPAIETWPFHHLWGYSEGHPFSTAKQRINNVTYDDVEDPSIATITNEPFTEGFDFKGKVRYERLIMRINSGIRVVTTIHSDGNDTVSELWESIPIYLRDANLQSNLNRTSIEYFNGSTWHALSDDHVETSVVRLGRTFGNDTGFVFLLFDSDVTLKLSGEVWTPDYQTQAEERTIHIDLHGNPGTPSQMNHSVTVGYNITVMNKELTFGFHGSADYNNDGIVSFKEIRRYLDRWIEGDVSIDRLLRGINRWKGKR